MKSDRTLQEDVLAELAWEPAVSAGQIGVAGKDGAVTLFGHVDNFWSRFEAEKIDRRVEGVKVISEEIEVQLPTEHKINDSDIARTADDRLAANASFPKRAMKVLVEKGRASLSGQVEWRFQKNIAADDLRHLRGVTGLLNRMESKTQVSSSNIKVDITKNLKRSWYTRPDAITVVADGGIVTLNGFVHSPHAKSIATMTAWAVPRATRFVHNPTIN